MFSDAPVCPLANTSGLRSHFIHRIRGEEWLNNFNTVAVEGGQEQAKPTLLSVSPEHASMPGAGADSSMSSIWSTSSMPRPAPNARAAPRT